MEIENRRNLAGLLAVIFDAIDKAEEMSSPIIDAEYETVEVLERLSKKLKQEDWGFYEQA